VDRAAAASATNARSSAAPGGILTGRKGVILGVANDRSLAWAIARHVHGQGGVCAFTYQNERTGDFVIPLFQQVESPFYEILDVMDSAATQEVLDRAAQTLGGIDFVVHAIAGGPRKDDLSGRYMNTSEEGFVNAMRISVFSLTTITAAAYPHLTEDASIVALSHYGAEKVFTGYNVMAVAKAALQASVRYLAADLGPEGIRVNAIASSPQATRAASGIGTYEQLADASAAQSLLRRNATKDEVAATCVFLLSPLSGGITGQTLYVDAGLSAAGIILPDET
jgi:enoyl-[acyl-carrier protein] reductase I